MKTNLVQQTTTGVISSSGFSSSLNVPSTAERLTALAALFCFSLFASDRARATDFDWAGDISNVWDDTTIVSSQHFSNWSPDGGASAQIPDTGDTVSFGGTASGFVVDLNGDRTVSSATFSGASSYSINNNTLTLESGDLSTSGSSMHIINSKLLLAAEGN